MDEFDWDFWDAHAVYAEDPARNVIELIAFAGLDEGGGAAFSGASILALADLGLPVPDPRVAVASLAETFGIGLWDRPEVTPDRLSPVGGRGATLLVVRIGRVWHLGEAAAAQPLA